MVRIDEKEVKAEDREARLREKRVNLKREAVVMMGLGSNHPHVVSLIGIITTGDLTVISSFEANGDLKQFLETNLKDGTPVLLKEKERWAHEIANGMKHVSGLHIVHRDVAARNVMVSESRICKIADFEFARVMKKKTKEELETDGEKEEADYERYYYRSDAAAVPVRWTAPEGLGLTLSRTLFSTASDVWSYAIVIVEIWQNGSRPYPQLNLAGVRALLRDDPTFVHPKPDGCSRELYTLLTDCWERHPAKRPSFSQILKRLEGMHSWKPSSYQQLETNFDSVAVVTGSGMPDTVNGRYYKKGVLDGKPFYIREDLSKDGGDMVLHWNDEYQLWIIAPTINSCADIVRNRRIDYLCSRVGDDDCWLYTKSAEDLYSSESSWKVYRPGFADGVEPAPTVEPGSPSVDTRFGGGGDDDGIHQPFRDDYDGLSKRDRVLAEIKDEQGRYLGVLKVIIEKFMRPLAANPKISKADHKAIFSNVTDLLAIHDEFNKMIGKAMASTTGRMLSVPFLTMLPKMRIHAQYCCDVSKASNILTNLNKSKVTAKILKDAQAASGQRLKDLINVPMQRVLRYPLLLNELIKSTPERHKDCPGLINAKAAADNLAEYINKTKSDHDTLMGMIAGLTGYKGPPLEQFAPFVKDGDVMYKDCKSSNKEEKRLNVRYAFMLQSAIVLTQPHKAKYKYKSLCKLEPTMKLASVAFRKLPRGEQNSKFSFCWALQVHGENQHIFAVKTLPLKKKWMTQMNQLIEDMENGGGGGGGDKKTGTHTAEERANSEMTSPKPSAESRNYQAMYDYAPILPKEMQLTKNDIVTVLDKSHKDWWKVQRGAEKGMVPANYLKPI